MKKKEIFKIITAKKDPQANSKKLSHLRKIR